MRYRGEVTQGIPTAGKWVWVCSFSCSIFLQRSLPGPFTPSQHPSTAVPRLRCRFQTPLGCWGSEEGSPVLLVAAEHCGAQLTCQSLTPAMLLPAL